MLLSARMYIRPKGRKKSSYLLLLCEFIVTDYARSFKPLEQILSENRRFFAPAGARMLRYAPGEREGLTVGVAVGTGVTVGSTAGM